MELFCIRYVSKGVSIDDQQLIQLPPSTNYIRKPSSQNICCSADKSRGGCASERKKLSVKPAVAELDVRRKFFDEDDS
ncbi:hypothetical protein Q1695_000260 [Nippostrongylus brasiliensis]|nr:hypothetical protein Q1695_000260 [Nippostrongylus brasiliensis]